MNTFIQSSILIVLALILFVLWRGNSPKFGEISPLINYLNPYSPEVSGNNFVIGKVREYRASIPIAATSSVICSIRTPTDATTTPTFLSLRFTSNVFVNNSLTISTSTSAYGSSTPAFVATTLSATPAKEILWRGLISSSSPDIIGNNTSTGESLLLLPPATFINWRIASSAPSSFPTYSGGFCRASLLAL